MNTLATNLIPKLPGLPAFLAKPVGLLPQKFHSGAIVKMLNTVLKESLEEGDLDFLEAHSVSVEVSDLNLRFALSLQQEKLVASCWQESDHLNLRGNFYDFLLLASRKEDADTLFFQRRLKITGDTNLGLEVKNLLDGLDVESIRYHQQIDFTLKHAVSVYERLFKR